MGMTDKSLCDSCTNIGCEFQFGIVRTKCAFYMPPQLEPDNCGNYVVQDLTTKNDLGADREDAVERLNALKQFIGYDKDSEIVKATQKSLDMAVKALEQEPRWIPIVRREPTDEEKADYLAQYGEELCYMLENEMPLDGQEVLVSIGEFVSEDVFDEDFYNFENNDIENVDAWMPLPEPYKSESEDKE